MSTCTHVYMSTCTHVYMYTCLHVHMSTYTHVYIYTCLHIHMSTYTHVYIYTCLHIHMSTYTHVYMHTCLHVHMYTHPRGPVTRGRRDIYRISHCLLHRRFNICISDKLKLGHDGCRQVIHKKRQRIQIKIRHDLINSNSTVFD